MFICVCSGLWTVYWFKFHQTLLLTRILVNLLSSDALLQTVLNAVGWRGGLNVYSDINLIDLCTVRASKGIWPIFLRAITLIK